MTADSFFWIGSTHDVCQDYALNTMFRGQEMVAVFDGCSSSPDTDIGARILARSLIRCERLWNHKDFELFLMSEASHMREVMHLEEEALDSTMIVATPEEIRMYGDGSIIIEYEDSTIDVFTAEYSNNAPRYLNYLLDTNRFENYKNLFGGTLNVKCLTIDADGGIVPSGLDQKLDRDSGLLKVIPSVRKQVKNITVMSDGLSSFVREVETETSRVEEPVPLPEVVSTLLAFRNYNGVFAKRRAKRFIKDCRKWKWQNTDDVSIGVIHL